jgi:hypothetical protein
MIDGDGRVLCDRCTATKNMPTTMARLKGSVIVIWGRHHGEQHEQTIELREVLPSPDSEEYAALVADLLRRIPAMA